jgi:rhamnulokinase
LGRVEVASVDLGGASGRVMLGRIGPGELALCEVHRFPNRSVQLGRTLYWNAPALFRGILDGLREAGSWTGGQLDSVGVDSWGVDYGLLDGDGELLGNPVHYRDPRFDGVAAVVHRRVPAAALYAVAGVQELPFNTVYQLVAEAGSARLSVAKRLLMLPDLMNFWLTGEVGAELTVCSTTGLLDVRRRCWSVSTMRRLDIDPDLFAPLRSPGDPAGALAPHVLAETGLTGPVPVRAVGSHDTASALVGTPVATRWFGYISCGTWSLVGLETDAPVLSEDSRLGGFSNELGVDGTVRYLHNVMGLWLLQESLRSWGPDVDLAELLAAAAGVPALRSVVDADSAEFLAPGDMPARIAAACRRLGQPVPESRAELVRCILDSLALAYRRTLYRAAELAGQDFDVVHLIGGGSHNALLCQLTADACERPVVAGPAEAAALGNALTQARALGAAPDSLAGLRALVAEGYPVTRYEPETNLSAWRSAASRLEEPETAVR